MDASTQKQLNAINRDFYATQASEFAETRDHPWPGWERAWKHVRLADRLRVLDVGCGSGRFATFLADQAPTASIDYVGIDASAPLLERARGAAAELSSATCLCVDWVEDVPETCLPRGPFDLVALLGALHHVPGHAQRRALLRMLAERLVTGGTLALTAWRFAAPEVRSRFEERIVPWEEWKRRNGSALDLERLEPGDFLLRWGAGPDVVRYCHFADEEEMAALLLDLPVDLVEQFHEDGRGRNLNHYVILRAR
ncbi:MAG: class I SAM-dependent methyltransferase [Myxococcota bacterium]